MNRYLYFCLPRDKNDIGDKIKNSELWYQSCALLFSNDMIKDWILCETSHVDSKHWKLNAIIIFSCYSRQTGKSKDVTNQSVYYFQY